MHVVPASAMQVPCPVRTEKALVSVELCSYCDEFSEKNPQVFTYGLGIAELQGLLSRHRVRGATHTHNAWSASGVPTGETAGPGGEPTLVQSLHRSRLHL